MVLQHKCCQEIGIIFSLYFLCIACSLPVLGAPLVMNKLHFFVLQNAVSQIVGPMILNSATVRDVHTLDDFYRALN